MLDIDVDEIVEVNYLLTAVPGGTPGTPWKVTTPVYPLYDAFLRLTTPGLEGR